MKQALLCFYLLIVSLQTYAQSSRLAGLTLPELRKKLAESRSDTDRVQLQLALGRSFIDRSESGNEQLDSALQLADQALKTSQKIAYHHGIITARINSALYWNRKGNTDKGFQVTKEALAFAKKVNNASGIAESYIIMGHHYDVSTGDGLVKRMAYNDSAITVFRKANIMLRLAITLKDEAELLFLAGKKTEAVKLLFEALNIEKSIGQKDIHAIYWLLGRTCSDMGDFPNAIKYNMLAIKSAKEVKDSTLLLCSIYHTTAYTYNTMKEYARSIPYFLLALQVAKQWKNAEYIRTVSIMLAYVYTRTNNLKKGMTFVNDLKKYSTNYEDDLLLMNTYLSNLTYAKEFKQAGAYALKVKSLLAKMSADNYTIFRVSYSCLSLYYLATKQYRYAKYYNDLYAEIVYKINFATGIKNAENISYQLDSAKGDFKSAIGHYLAAQRIKDSIENVTKAYQISLLHIENETEKKNEDINALKKQAELKDSQLKRTQLIQKVVVVGSILLLIITALIYSRYRLKQRSNALLMEQKSEIDKQNVDLQNLVQDKDLLLKEVNHRVKNNLQIVMSLLQSQSGNLNNQKAQEAILESQNRVRSIALIHDQLFNTNNITEIQLPSYVNDLVHALDSSLNQGSNKVSIDISVDDILLDVSQAIPVGIILNEIMTNALKYAFPGNRTGNISVTIRQVNKNIEIRIADNGVGLPADFSLSKENSLGITLINGLTIQLKGVFSIENNNGVTVIIKFPVETAPLTKVAAIA